MVLRTEDPPDWSYEEVSHRNTPATEQLYRVYVRGIRNLSEKDWDLPILVCGREGSGKSAYALNLACDLDDDIIDNIEDHVLWNAQRDITGLELRIKRLPPSVFIMDEAGVDLMSRNSMQKEQKELVELFMIMRQYNHILILVMPKMKWLDSYLRDHRVVLWVQVNWRGPFFERQRGFSVVRYAQHDDFASVPYWSKMFSFRFPDFPMEIEEKYKRLKRDNSLMRSESDELSDRERIVLHARSQGHTLVAIGDFIGVSHTMVRKIIIKAEAKQEDGKQEREDV